MARIVERISDRWTARIRTVWPYVIGAVASVLLVKAAPVVEWLRAAGVPVTEATAQLAVGAGLGWLVWDVGTWLERRPGAGRLARVARGAGRWLVSLGLHTGGPSYGRGRR